MKKILATVIAVLGLTAILSSCKNEVLTDYYFEENSAYSVGGGEELAENVSKIDIGWISGKVAVKTDKTVDKIVFSEEYNGDDEYKMRYIIENGVLKIRYAKNGADIKKEIAEKKNLTVLVPDGKSLTELETETVSASCLIDGILATKMDLSSVSGRIESLNCTVGNGGYECETVSGAIVFNGEINGTIDLSTVSGNAEISLKNALNSIDCETVSGNVKISLPSDTKGFKVDFETTSGDFACNKEFTKNKNIYTYGDESTNIDAESVSGGISIEIKD